MAGHTGATAPFSIGAAVSGSFAELAGRFVHYALLIAIPLSPLIAFGVLQPAPVIDPTSVSAGEMQAFWGYLALSSAIAAIVYAVAMGSFAYAVVSSRRGNPVGLAHALGEGVRRLPYTLTTLLALFVVFVLVYIAAVAIVVAAGMGLGLALGQTGRTIGLVLGVVGGLLIFFRILLPFFVAWPVAAAEKAWPVTALRRSWFLTKGRLWALFGVLAVLFVLFLLAGVIVIFGLGAVFGVSFFDPSSVQAAMESGDLVVMNIASAVVSLPLYAFALIAPAVVYYLLSIEKDGRDLDGVEDVFE